MKAECQHTTGVYLCRSAVVLTCMLLIMYGIYIYRYRYAECGMAHVPTLRLNPVQTAHRLFNLLEPLPDSLSTSGCSRALALH